ncbi:GNAT family N-acetyltransferase [Roseobacter sp. CCS2]|uniref:GNAT family N-acetyltransferase n=1 Tax=Roseobacter sp. CCS2 TaxID=391593 RepID=UPI0000F3BFB1|nr:GNAT family N-acetyltransferase [Roseobacter sp. CCS2]EBA10576.1 acetyltransferase [Roseobacter sp. CCS2]
MTELHYRFLNADDFDDMHAMVSHWSVVRQLGRWPWPPQEAFTRGRCKPYAGHGFVWAVCLNDRVIGTMAVTQGELGYMFVPDVHSKGYATKVACDAIAMAFAEYDWPILRASVWHDNPASAAVLRKCGFAHWQTHYTRSPARLPTLVHQYRLPRTTWDRLRTAPQ